MDWPTSARENEQNPCPWSAAAGWAPSGWRSAPIGSSNTRVASLLANALSAWATALRTDAQRVGISPPERDATLQKAKQLCERSLALWQEVRERDMLNSQDAGKPEFAAQELAACNDLLARR